MNLIVKIKNCRIWLPKYVQNVIGNEFIEIKIKQAFFITKLTKDGRFFVPKRFRKNLPDASYEAKITILRNLKRPNKLRLTKRIDILSFIPKKTMSGYDILALEENDGIRLWYSTKGRPNEMKIKRFVPADFLILLGYYQAEGGKAKLSNRRGREMNFTNKSLIIVEDFLHYLSYLIDTSQCKIKISHHPSHSLLDLEKVRQKLISLGINKANITSLSGERIKTYVIRVWISNSLLSEVICNTMNKIRHYLVKSKPFNKLIIYFLQGLIAGDGNFYSVRDARGSLHSFMRIYEGNGMSVVDYSILFKKLGFAGKIRKDSSKELFQFYFNPNWDQLLKIYKFGLLDKSFDNKRRLIATIKSHRNYKFAKSCNTPKARKLAEQVKSFEITR